MYEIKNGVFQHDNMMVKEIVNGIMDNMMSNKKHDHFKFDFNFINVGARESIMESTNILTKVFKCEVKDLIISEDTKTVSFIVKRL